MAGDYGQVLLNFKDGEITGVTEKNDWNDVSFEEHVAKPVTRLMVKSKKVLEQKTENKIVDDNTENLQNDTKSCENGTQGNTELQNIDNGELKNEK